MIAEFYGLPGSGKSTLMNYMIAQKPDVFQKNRTGKSIPTVCHLRNALTPEFLGFAIQCYHMYFSKKQKWSTDSRFVRSMLRIYLIFMWERQHGGREYRCFDHGIVQFFAAMSWTEFYLRDALLKMAEYFCRHMHAGVKLIYMQTEAYDQILRRNVQRGEYRRLIDEVEREKALEILIFQNDLFNEIYSIADRYGMCIRLNAMDSVEDSAASLWEAVEG